MPDYKQGKIYKIVSDKCDAVYYGSTVQTLKARFRKHKSQKIRACCIIKYFDKYGFDNFRIELVEDYPCDNDKQLRMKEQEYIGSNECVNEQRAYATYEEKQEDLKRLRRVGKEDKHEYDIQYREANREAIRERKRIKIVCECGKTVNKNHIVRHRKSEYHLSRV